MMCQNFISTHAHKIIRATQGVRSKHYTSIVAIEPLVTIQTYFGKMRRNLSQSEQL